MSDERSATEKAMDKDCIFLLAASIIILHVASVWGKSTEKISTKCRGPECAEFDVFTSRCGFAK